MAHRNSSTSNVPERGDPDRKRVLNVLAQRRYRQRRKEKIQALETKTTGPAAFMAETETGQQCSEPWPNSTGNLGGECNYDSTLWSEPFWIYGAAGHAQDNPTNDSSNLNFLGDSTDICAELQSFETAQFTFPDDTALEVSELQVLKAGFCIAEMLGCADSVYDITAQRVFDSATLPISQLPPNLEYTEVQRRVPHHPLFDILPWPSVRTKLICVFAQPIQMRPPAARDPLALMQLLYDMDDSAEGFRFAGAEAYKETNWEVGQAFFTNWWWALDRTVVENSNLLRAKRGAEKLRLMPDSS